MMLSSHRNTASLLLPLTILVAPYAAQADMRGDEAAIGLAHQMIQAMGGHEVWSNAVWMHVKERSFAPNQPNALAHEAWRGLQVMQARYTTKNQDVSYEQAWNQDGGWRVLNGEYLQFDEVRHGQETDFWHREIYTMYHRFAVGDPELRLTSTGDRAFRVEHAETGDPLGTFSISAEGGVLVWSSGNTDDDVTYVYGPLKSFGEINLPAWGAQTNGGWRFNYLEATLHDSPMPAQIVEP